MVILDSFKDTSQCQHLRNGGSTRAKAILVISQTEHRMNVIQGCVFSRGSSWSLPEFTRRDRYVRVRYQLGSFAQLLARCSSLAQTKYMTRHNAAVIELYFDGNAKGSQACRLFSSLVLLGAQPVVLVRRRSSILRCSCLRRAHTGLIRDL